MSASGNKPPKDPTSDPAQLWRYSDAVHRLHSTPLLSAEEESAGRAATAEYDRVQAFIAAQAAEVETLRRHHNQHCSCGKLL